MDDSAPLPIPHRLAAPRSKARGGHPSLEQIAPRVGRLDRIAHDVSDCSFDHLAQMVRPFRGPIPEAGSEASGRGGRPFTRRRDAG